MIISIIVIITIVISFYDLLMFFYYHLDVTRSAETLNDVFLLSS